MRNHDQKSRDMARSILPSTARRQARERKQRSARDARVRNRARLQRLRNHLDDPDAFEEALHRYDLTDTGWDGMVDDRRGHDKVAPLIRWAEARLTQTPRLADGGYRTRRQYFAGLLGETVVGRHALGHLDHLFGDEDPWAYGSYPGEPTWEEQREERRAVARAGHAERARLLNEVLAGADARRLNARIRVLTPPVERRWFLDSAGEQAMGGTSEHEPWLFNNDREAWLTVGPSGADAAQAIAFQALTEVHLEMFPVSPSG